MNTFKCKSCGYQFEQHFMATMDYCKKCVPSVIDTLLQSHEKLVEALKEISKEARDYRELVCGYMNGETLCDCKYLKGRPSGEQTGCCEFRELWIIAKQALAGAKEIEK